MNRTPMTTDAGAFVAFAMAKTFTHRAAHTFIYPRVDRLTDAQSFARRARRSAGGMLGDQYHATRIIRMFTALLDEQEEE